MPRITCPTCGAALQVEDDTIGQRVECGSCQAVFVAQASRPSARPAGDEDRPSRRRRTDRDEDDEDDRPARRRRPRRYEDDDDEDDYRPRRRRRAGGDGNGLAVTSLILGIASLPMAFCCGLFSFPVSVLGIIFGVLGMKSSGRGMAITGLVLSSVGVVLAIAMVVLGLAINLAQIGPGKNNKPPFGPPPRFNNQPPPRNFR
jgi:predicted Zn finger-like uncharacterized protein